MHSLLATLGRIRTVALNRVTSRLQSRQGVVEGAAALEALKWAVYLQDLGIQRQRWLSHLLLKQDLIQQLSQPGQGAETAAIAEIQQGLGAKRLEIGVAGDVRMGQKWRSAGPGIRAGRGSRTRAAVFTGSS
jgi:hypothetical protein